MKTFSYVAFLVLAFALVGCGEKQDQSDAVPPGFCKTEAECQPQAARENTSQAELRQKRIAQGVHEQYLPCGNFKSVKAPNGFWKVTHDTTGCPPTATQQDPNPTLAKPRDQRNREGASK